MSFVLIFAVLHILSEGLFVILFFRVDESVKKLTLSFYKISL